MPSYPIDIGESSLLALQEAIYDASKLMVLADDHTYDACYPLLQPYLPSHHICVITPGESFKVLETCQLIWDALTREQFDRKGILINLGGGVIGDMGGFVAGTYKRGIRFVQLPTTLLAQVDASVGSKLGIDFKGFKNHIGLFLDPVGVYIYPPFLTTLPERQFLSGFAEVIKHHLIADGEAWNTLKAVSPKSVEISGIIAHSVGVKSRIVHEDPFEHGIRKALNFGHTIGHAIESYFLEHGPLVLHGEAVAAGMIVESFISMKKGLLTEAALYEISRYISSYYTLPTVGEDIFENVFSRMKNDKKNLDGKIMCTLLDGVGKVQVNSPITLEDTQEALRFYNSKHSSTSIL
ncbi:MAG: 3-dehydroquinate synthase [Bacteroidota bacterium]